MECHSTNEVTIRTLGHFPPDIWGDSFSDFGVAENLRMQEYLEEIEPLKEEVRAMLIDESMDCDTKMRLIDGVERLGLYYYFDDEIVRLLDQRFEETVARNFDLDGNLYDVACQFRTFRQHGYKMPCAVFNKFTNGKGKFKESLTNDERGMVSLYEAAHLRIKGEHILDEALLFATDFLRSEKPSTEQARHALKQASHLGIPRLESFHFIAFYEEDLSHDGTLLQLAKLEFNRMQLLYRQELNQFQRWCKEREFARKLGHVRQRIVESHFWALAMYYEPQYSFARVIVAKLILVIPILDDTYDAYGTFEELQLLTDAFDR
ncbi:hypothetical protein RND81_07G074900 [Saponaria officinalis]|uniref:Uncharacterized protein n=1 Tax=Saponaria officinalis TaxID=3572 RepID=A0AAW1JL39_SAPOF